MASTAQSKAKPAQKSTGAAGHSKPAPHKAAQAKAAPAKAVAGKVLAKPAVAAKPLSPAANAMANKTVGAKPVAAKTPSPAAVKVAAPPATAVKVPPHVASAQKPGAPKPATGRAMPAAVAMPMGQRISAPAAAPVATPKDLAQKAQAAQQAQQSAATKKPVNVRHGFKTNEWIVYPAHGVGRIVAIEEQEIAGMALELFVITFEKDKMTLRVPTGKSASVGMRKLAEEGVVKRAMETLKGKARIKRTMWSRRAQEFEQKINSGDLVYIAEVVRDLFRAETQPEQSYSERQLYEAALDRMAREIAAVEKIDERGAIQRVTEVLARSAKSRRVEAGEATATDVKAA